MRESWRMTSWACYLSYMVQAVVNTLPTLLYAAFRSAYGLSVAQLGLLAVLNFGFQVVIDLSSAPIAAKLGYRNTMRFGHVCVILGLSSLALLPRLIGFPGIVLSMMLDGLGGGVVDVLASPIIQAMPDEKEKSGALTVLFGFYAWGTVCCVVVTNVLLKAFAGNWHLVPLCWLVLPAVCLALFARCPIAPLIRDGERGMRVGELLRSPVFLLLAVMMGVASSAEFGISQWSSYFAEVGLGVDKVTGDLLGPCLFFLLMALVRMTLGRRRHIPVRRWLVVSSLLCFAGYLVCVFCPVGWISLLGCASCGAWTALYWPGTIAMAGLFLPLGGTTMYAILAFCGDLGCAVGPEAISLLSHGGDLHRGILYASAFPLAMAVLAFLLPWVARRGGRRQL